MRGRIKSVAAVFKRTQSMTGCKINGAALPCDTPFWTRRSCFIHLCLPQLTFSPRFIPFNPSTRQQDAQVIRIMPAFLPNIKAHTVGLNTARAATNTLVLLE